MGAKIFFSTSKTAAMNTQFNYLCIYSNFSENKNCELHFIKQKSETWFDVRNTVHVTGSTANVALGLDTLKNQAVME